MPSEDEEVVQLIDGYNVKPHYVPNTVSKKTGRLRRGHNVVGYYVYPHLRRRRSKTD